MRLIVCARFAHMFSCHVLPRVAHPSSLCQHARRSECHTVFRTSVYLFFASFPLPERVSRHHFMCARAQKPERFFLLLHLSCIHVTCCFLSYRCLHLWGWILLLTSQMLYVAVQCHYVALGLLLGLLLVPCYINQKSLLICTACTLSNRSYYKFRSVNISACLP